MFQSITFKDSDKSFNDFCSKLFRKLLIISFEKIIEKCDDIHATQLFIFILMLIHLLDSHVIPNYPHSFDLLKHLHILLSYICWKLFVGFFRFPASPGISCRWTVSAAFLPHGSLSFS